MPQVTQPHFINLPEKGTNVPNHEGGSIGHVDRSRFTKTAVTLQSVNVPVCSFNG